MDDVVRRIQPHLRAAGFRKQRNAFARAVADGVQHAVAFQMGRHEPSPDRQPGLYGAFTVELGVYFEQVARVRDARAPRFVRPYDCHVRQRLGFLLPEPHDRWWTLDQPADTIAEAMIEALDEVALPWLDALSTPQAVLAAKAAGDSTVRDCVVVPPVVVAALHYVSGDHHAAAEVVRHEVRTTQARGAAENFVDWAQRLGLDVSMDDATIVHMLEQERAEWTRSDI
jgi:hypothetical protein